MTLTSRWHRWLILPNICSWIRGRQALDRQTDDSMHRNLYVTLARSPTSSSLKNNRSLLLLCFTLSLEPTPFICSSTSFWYQFLHFLLTYSFANHFFLFWFTTLLIQNSLSFTLGLKPTIFTNPTSVVSLLPPRLSSCSIARTVSSEVLGICF